MNIIRFFTTMAAFAAPLATTAQNSAVAPQPVVVDMTAIINQVPRVEIKVDLAATANDALPFTTVVTLIFVNFGTTSVDEVWVEPIDANGSILGRINACVTVIGSITTATAMFPGAHTDVDFGGIVECTDPENFLTFRRGINRVLSIEEENINVDIEPRSKHKQQYKPQPRQVVPITPIRNLPDLGCVTPPSADGVFLFY